MSAAARHYMAPDSRVLLVWVKSCGCVFSALSTNITREVCLYLASLYSVLVTATQLLYFDLHRMERLPPVTLLSPIRASGNSRWVSVDETKILHCGGGTRIT